MRDRIAAMTCLCIVLGVGGIVLLRRGREENRTPEDAVHAAFRAARAGELKAYLRCFSGDLREEIRSVVAEVGTEEFYRANRERCLRLTGLAISRSESDSGSENSCITPVESVFKKRNERQDYRLDRGRSGWCITAIGKADTVEMPIPYGTPVVPDLPDIMPASE